jgi:hypothetical protein
MTNFFFNFLYPVTVSKQILLQCDKNKFANKRRKKKQHVVDIGF